MARAVRRAGYGVEIAEGPRKAREVVGAAKIDLAVVVSAQLGANGAELVDELHEAVGKVIVARDGGAAKPNGAAFRPGALELADPRDESELIQRIGQALVPAAPDDDEEQLLLRFEDWTLDPEGRTVRDAAGRLVALTAHEFDLLLHFVRNPGRARSREQLRKAIGGQETDAFDRGIDMHVSRLRRKIERDSTTPRLVVTVPGTGYRFDAHVEQVIPAARVHRVEGPTPISSAAPAEPAAPPERRPLTVLQCSIDGLSALADERDPEEVRERTAALGALCAEIIDRYGGTVARFVGDGLTAYFGYPQAHEDDAARAIRAGLDLRTAIDKPDRRLPGGLGARIAIASGAAVIGDLGFGGDAPGAVGRASQVAARLSAAADRGWVIVGGEARRAAGRGFAYRRLDALRLAGFDEPIQAWRVLHDVPHLGRFAARHGGGLAPFSGRAEELAMLRQRWRQACSGAGQVVLVTGEPGIGKSRLAHELQHAIAASGPSRLRLFASPYHREAPLFPVLRLIERAARFSHGDRPQQRLAKLGAMLDRFGCNAKAQLALLADLLSVPHNEAERVRGMSPRQRKEAGFALLRELLDRTSAAQPVLLLWEDAQWLDSLSLELLAATVEQAERRPLLVLVTARPDFRPPWPEHAHVGHHRLGRLGRAEAEAMVQHIAGQRLPEPALRDIAERGDGVPLFLEELTKAALLPPPRGVRAGPVPDDLQALLLARIDWLGPAGKAVARIGAAIGRNFSHELLRLVGSEEPLDEGLARLEEAELVFRRGSAPDESYEFKHALVRDAAYGMLSDRQRRDIHGRIAAALETRFADTAATQPELLAHHFAEAGNAARAVRYLIAAAENSLFRGAISAAVAKCGEAMRLLAQLPADPSRRRLELETEIVLGRAMAAQKSPASPEARAAFARARQLCESLGDTAVLPWVVNCQRYTSQIGGQYAEGVEQATTLLRLGEREGHSTWQTTGNYGIGACLMWLGRFERAQRHLAAAIERGAFELPGGRIATYGAGDTRISAIGYLGNCLFLLGRSAEAKAAAERLFSECAQLSHPFARSTGLSNLCRTNMMRRKASAVLRDATALLTLSEHEGYPMFAALALVYRGWALAVAKRDAEALEFCRRGIAGCRESGTRIGLALAFGLCAEAAHELGKDDNALAFLQEAEGVTRDTGEGFWQAELLRLKGEILANRGNATDAEACFRRALDVAIEQQAYTLQLRAATSLARLWRRHGRSGDVKTLIAPICETYLAVGGSADCSDLREATAMLSEQADRRSAVAVANIGKPFQRRR
ncbi:MAG TPA: AAA family ATPase [Stellaceae bacterium]|nr:AAA family ATPase [Stellaceae bacterium]